MLAANRILKLQEGDRLKEISIRIFVPEPSGNNSWACRYEIDWPEKMKVAEAGGADSVQALFLAMQMIGSEIYTSSYHKSGKLYLDELNKGYGFPVPVTLRDLLVGDDKKYM
jgi:hypothetical protein